MSSILFRPTNQLKKSILNAKTKKSVKIMMLLFIPSIFIFLLAGVAAGLTGNLWLINGASLLAFLVFVGAHIITYDNFKNSFTEDQLRVQMLLANASNMVVLLTTANKSAYLSAWGLADWNMSFFTFAFLLILMLIAQIKDNNNSLKKALSKELFFESFSGILLAGIFVALLAELHLLWKTYYVFIPIATGLILFATTTNDGVINENERLNWKIIIPSFFSLGGLSLVCQFFAKDIKVPFWVIMLAPLLLTSGILLFKEAKKRYSRMEFEVERELTKT